MNDANIQDIIKATIETQVVLALNSVPEAIEKLVKAALSKPVDENGKFDGYRNTMPYLDFIVGDEIRRASRDAVQRVVQERATEIENEVRKGLSSEAVVAAVTKSIVGAANDSWRIAVKFESDKE